MAAVSAEGELMAEELRQDRAQRALQVAIVSGFLEDSRSMQESCLDLCNACRDGVPAKCIVIQDGAPLSLRSVFLPNDSSAGDDRAATRVLQPRRVIKARMMWEDHLPEDTDYAMHASGLSDVHLTSVIWPEGIKEVQLILFDQALEEVAWPKSLERLSFFSERFHVRSFGPWSTGPGLIFPPSRRGLFNHPLQGVSFPSGLREIFLGNSFDQPIEGVAWPCGLERLSLPAFNHSIDNVRWPPRLKALEFLCPSQILLRKREGVRVEELLDGDVEGFNRSFTTLPASLETLWLSNAFDQDSLADIAWPPGLTTLGLGMSFGEHRVGRISWPLSLKRIYSAVQLELDNPRLILNCEVFVVKDYDTESQSYDPDEYDFEHDLDGHLYDPDVYDPDYPEDCYYDGSDFIIY